MGLLDTISSPAAIAAKWNEVSGIATSVGAPKELQTLAEKNAEGKDVSTPDPMWFDKGKALLDFTRWSKLYPYQLKVISAENTYDIEGNPNFTTKATFTLPIPPEAIQISTPFAINTQVTLGGIIEEHNAAPIRLITLRGTTGLLPYRPTAMGKGPLTSFGTALYSIAGGTIQQATNAVRSIAAVGSPFAGTNAPNQLSGPEKEEQDPLSGYAQWRLLQRFLERYTTAKKTKQGATLRLALCMWKDEAVYLVTPTQFEVTKDASSPLEYRYTLQFKAWKRINLQGAAPDAVQVLPIRQEPTLLAKGLETLRKAQQANKAIGAIPQAIIADYNRLINEPLRQATLTLKTLQGAALNVGDLPQNLQKQWEETKTLSKTLGNQYWDAKNWGRSSPTGTAPQTSGSKVTTLDFIAAQRELNNNQDAKSLQSHPVNNVDVSDVPITAANIPPNLYRLIQEEVNRQVNKSRTDWEKDRNDLQKNIDNLAAQLGVVPATYRDTYQTKLPATTKTPTTEDYDNLQTLQNAVKVLTSLALTNSKELDTVKARFDYFRSQAAPAGIPYPTPNSKFAVPFPYGSTLQTLAQLYLQNPDRWVEIATLNNLQAPYIDEEGYTLPFLTNGIDNQFTVATSTYSNYIKPGSTVYLSSRTVYNQKYQVVSAKVTPTYSTFKVDRNVTALTTQDNAILHAYLPNTINSQKLIWIPLDTTVEEKVLTKSIPGVDEYNTMTQKGGVDLQLNTNGDLIITNTGDNKLAVGLTNIIQNLRSQLNTNVGSLPLHPNYGLPNLGDTTATTDLAQAKQAILNMLQADGTFSSVENISLKLQNGALQIFLNTTVSGTDTPLPINYTIKQ